MDWKIVADSSCDLTAKDIAEDGIGCDVIPMSVIAGNREFTDNEDLNIEEMFAYLEAYPGPSSSSCPAPGEFAAAFSDAKNSVAVTISGKLSGSYNSACTAKELVLANHPEKKIHVIDTKTTSGGMILTINMLKKLIKEGLNFEQVVEKAEEYVKSLRVIFTLASFDTLMKNGRMSKMQALLASTLNIRAVARGTEQGEIQMVAKPRGERKALECVANLMGEYKKVKDDPVIISHCNNMPAALSLKEIIIKKYHNHNITIIPMKGVISYYATNMGLVVCF